MCRTRRRESSWDVDGAALVLEIEGINHLVMGLYSFQRLFFQYDIWVGVSCVLWTG